MKSKGIGLIFAITSSWIVAVYVLWHRSPLAALAMLFVGSIAVLWALRTNATAPQRTGGRLSAADAEKQARFVVTQMLSVLTRAQLAYLGQDFDSPAEAKAWLKKALPRAYRPLLDSIHDDLEAARRGTPPPGLRLALKLRELGKTLDAMQRALNAAKKERPNHAVASPVAFVITDAIDVDGDAEPTVITLASFDPVQPTLLPQVEALTVFSEVDSGKSIRGQAEFGAARKALGDHLVPLTDEATEAPIYATRPYEDPAELQIPLSRPPLGFVISGSELV